MSHDLHSKLRIVIDLQGYQRAGNRVRGIGRYSLSLIKTLIHNYPMHEYILFSNSSLYNFKCDFENELEDKKLNLSYFEWSPSGQINEDVTLEYSRTWIATQLRSYAISLLHADIILLTSFFDGFKDNTLVDFDTDYNLPPVISIIYDLIPLIIPSSYLDTDEEFKDFYNHKVSDLKRLDALLTISESSKKEILKYTDFTSDKVFNISAACDQNLFHKNIIDNSSLSLNIDDYGKFLLYTGAVDPRKNLYRLIKAYSLLPSFLILKHKLVLTGPFSKIEEELIYKWIREFNLSINNIHILGYVSDSDLANLYRNCYLFVFPSIHEGFGLPVLEAMSCGAPIIASNCTSIPEILDFENALFDPYDIHEIKEKIISVCSDDLFYKSLKDYSEIRKNDFSWEITSLKTIVSINEILNRSSSRVIKNQSAGALQEENQINLNKLIKNIKQSPIFKSSNKAYLRRVSAAIDLINLQSKRFLLNKNLLVIELVHKKPTQLAIILEHSA